MNDLRQVLRPGFSSFAASCFAILLGLAPAAHGAAAAPVSSPQIRQTVRDARTLPTFESLRRAAEPFGIATITQSDTFLNVSNGFDNLDATCDPRGWSAQDLTARVFAHVSDRYVVNRDFLLGRGTTPMTAPMLPIAGTTLAWGGVIARNDSGRVVFFDNGCSWPPCQHKLYEAYPADNLLRQYSLDDAVPYVPRDITFDPLTGGMFIANGPAGLILQVPRGGGVPTVFVNNGDGIGRGADTTLAVAYVTAWRMGCDNAGNLYYSDVFNGRVRVIRRNDLRVITLKDLAGAGPLAVNPDGSELFYLNVGTRRIHRMALPSGTDTEISGAAEEAVVGQTQFLVWSAGTLYLATSSTSEIATSKIYRFSSGTLTKVAGDTDFFGDAGGQATGLGNRLLPVGGMCDDRAGGVYITSGNLVMRLRADDVLEPVAGDRMTMHMGARALRIGADLTTAPDEVANWVTPDGYGDGWSQRIVSPEFDLSALTYPVLTFDLASELGTITTRDTSEYGGAPDSPEFVTVQGQKPDGSWVSLVATWTVPVAGHVLQMPRFYGLGALKVRVALVDQGNEFVLSGTTRLRIVVQTNTLISDESENMAGTAGVVIDNLELKDGASDVFAPASFEDGTTGPWTLEALNGAYESQNPTSLYVRDVPPPANDPHVQSDFDFSDPSCVWTFTAANGTAPAGTFTRLTSPWFARKSSATEALIEFSGKLNTADQGRVVDIRVRGKRVGDERPVTYHFPSFLFFASDSGGDISSPLITDRVVRYPTDFQSAFFTSTTPADSVQLVIYAEDRGEQLLGVGVPRPVTKLPFLDDLRLLEVAADGDRDGVADVDDLCPSECAAGQDANGDGCIDPTATFHHIETWPAGQLIHYVYSAVSAGTVPGAYTALDLAFAAWQAVPGASVPLQKIATPIDRQVASPLDGVNQVTFADATFPFSPEVLAVTPTLEITRRTGYGDRIARPGEIVDKDILFNPGASFQTPTHPGTWDLQSVATHEIGHLLGLDHSGVKDATMYFVQQPGAEAATLTDDDRAAIAAAYPAASLATDYGSIRGQVTRDTLGTPVGGALITAVKLDGGGAPLDTVVSDYTDEDGSYALLRLPAGNYGVHIQALDGSVLDGMDASFVSTRLVSVTGIPFEPEWYDAAESARDDPAAKEPLAIAAGTALTGINIVTQLDTIPPGVVAVSPADLATDVGIDASVQVSFGDPIDPGTLNASFGVYPRNSAQRIAGRALISDYGRRVVFSPDAPLSFATDYDVRITTALKDQAGVPLASEFASTFRTQDQPPVSITSIQPNEVSSGALVTINGTGFDPTFGASNIVAFTQVGGPAFIDSVFASFVTPTSLVAAVPVTLQPGAVSVQVVVNDLLHVSNTFVITILPPADQPSPSPSGSAIAVGFAPTDVALSPDGAMAWVAGDGGVASVNIDAPPSGGPIRTAVSRHAAPARAIALSPDGHRAFVSHPADSTIVVLDADPESGTLGSVLATIHLVGASAGVAVAPTGRRLFATDDAGSIIHEVDVDPSSLTPYTEIRTRSFSPGGLTGGIAVTPDNARLILGSSSGAWYFWLATDSASPQGAAAVTGGVSASPTGGVALYSNGSPGVSPADGFPIFAGGIVKDVVHAPQGQAAYVVNGGLNRLQVLNTTVGPGYLQLSTSVTTGLSPVAAAVNAGGSLVAVANRGGQSLSLFQITQSGLPTFYRMSSDVALAGDLVAAQGDSASLFTETMQVDVAPAPMFPATISNQRGTGFRVPAMTQQETRVVLQRPDGVRTLGLPFRVVDPITSFVPASAAEIAPPLSTCPSLPAGVGGILKLVRTTPDGRRVALVRENPCGVWLDLYDVSNDGSQAPYTLLGTTTINIGAGESLHGADFTPDGSEFWCATSQLGVRVINTDPASGSFLATTDVLGTDGLITVLRDPLGNYMFTGGIAPAAVKAWVLNKVTAIELMNGTVAWSLAATGDGHYLLIGSAQNATIFNTNAFESIAATTQIHGPFPTGSDSMFLSIAVTSDGRRAVGLWGGLSVSVPRRFAVWNLDTLAGPLGQELYFGIPAGLAGKIPHSLTPGPDGHSVIASAVSSNELIELDVSTIPPTVTIAAAARAPGNDGGPLARSPDGRLLYAAETPSAGPTGSTGRLHAYALDEADAMVLEAGEGATGLGGSAVPVRVRLTRGAGIPVSGALVRFDTNPDGSNGTLGSPPRLTQQIATDLNGEVALNWFLPTAAGPVTATVTAIGDPGIAPITVNATVVLDDSQIAPEIAAFSPADGASGLNAGTPVGVRFNQRMAAAVTSHVSMTVEGNPVGGTYRLQDEGRFVVFQPTEPMPYNAHATITVTPGALDLDGQVLAAGGSASFTVQGPPAVRIDAIVPPAGPVGAAVTVAGTGFNAVPAHNTVLFDGVVGTVQTATATGLTLNVPLAAASGPVTVTANSSTSPPYNFIVLPPNADPGGIVGDLPGGLGTRDVALTPDGSRAYITNPSLNSVTALDLVAAQTITTIAVGLHPQSIAIVARPLRAYVANTNSNSVSVIDVDPLSPNYNRVVNTIPVGLAPVDVAVWPAGPKVFVLNSSSNTISIIDGASGNATFDQVTATVNCGAGATQVVISTDGTRAYVAMSAGLQIIDVANDRVMATVNCGSSATSVVLTTDGTLAFVLTSTGELAVIALTGPNENKVLSTTNCGAGAQQVIITTDGSLAYVTNDQGDVQVYQIGTGAGGGASTALPTPPVTLTRIETFNIGGAAAGLAADPLGRSRVVVANAGKGGVTVLGTPDALPRIALDFDFNPNTLNVKSMGRWVTGYLEPGAPFTADQIVIESIRLNDEVAVDPAAPHSIGDHDGDGIADLMVKFDRSAVQLLLESGDDVPVCATGRIDNRNFLGCDSIKVKHGKVTAPHANEVVGPNTTYTVRWESPRNTNVQWVAIQYTLDHGATWHLAADHEANDGAYDWPVPVVANDSVRVAVVFVETAPQDVPPAALDPDSAPADQVLGVFAMSDDFAIFGATDVADQPTALSFSLQGANPARGTARMRFGLPQATDVRLELFDVQGRKVKTLASGMRAAGWHTIEWRGEGESGARPGAGIYFVRFRAEGRAFVERLVWLK